MYDNSLELRFKETMIKEGICVRNITQNKDIKAFFRSSSKGISGDKTTKEFKKMFCNLDDIGTGDTLKLNNEYYIAMNRNNENSNVYSSSTIERCSEVWNIYGQEIHVVYQSDLMNPSTDIVNVFGQISGTLTCIVSDIQVIHKVCITDNILVTTKGCYKINNTFYDKGLAYIYLEKCPVDLSEYVIAAENINSLKVGETINLNAMVENGKTKCVNAVYEYQVDNSEVLSVDNSGTITALQAGNATITVAATYSLENSNGDIEARTITKVIEMSVLSEGGSTPEPTEGGYVEFRSLWGIITDEWTIDTGGIDIYAHLYDADGNENYDAIPTWKYKLYDKSGNEKSDINTYCRVSVDGDMLNVWTVHTRYYGLYSLVITAIYENGISKKLILELNK